MFPMLRLAFIFLLVVAAQGWGQSLAFLDEPKAWQHIQGLIEDKAHKADAVLAFARNQAKYPTPANAIGFRAGTDLQPGQVALEQLTAQAIDAHNALEEELLTLAGAGRLVPWQATEIPLPEQFAGQTAPPGFDPARLPRGERTWISGPTTRNSASTRDSTTTRPLDADLILRPPRATAMGLPMEEGKPVPIVLYPILRAWPAWQQYLHHLPTEENAPQLGAALTALGREDYATAERLSRQLTGRQRWFFDYLARQMVQAHNAQAGDASRPNEAELEVMESANAYRLALNLTPWIVDDRLQQAARGHSTYQDQRGKIGHEQETPESRHSWQRAQRQGYEASDLTEMISAGLGPWSVWGWRCDAAHHRALLGSQSRACGVGIVGQYVTCLTGSREESELGRLLLPAPPPARLRAR